MYTIGKKDKKPVETGVEARAHRTPEPDNPSAKYRRVAVPSAGSGLHPMQRKRIGLRRAQ